MTNARLSRRTFLMGGICAALSPGCSQLPVLNLAKGSLSAIGIGNSGYPRTRDQVEALPYAQIGIRVANGGRGILVLADQVGQEDLWVSANRVLIATRGGRITRTLGLDPDLRHTSFTESADFLDHYDFNAPDINGLEISRSIDSQDAFNVQMRSVFKLEASETITILDRPYETFRIREDVSCELWNWQFTNYHWASKKSRLLWRSRQRVLPNTETIELEVLKRPSSTL